MLYQATIHVIGDGLAYDAYDLPTRDKRKIAKSQKEQGWISQRTPLSRVEIYNIKKQ